MTRVKTGIKNADRVDFLPPTYNWGRGRLKLNFLIVCAMGTAYKGKLNANAPLSCEGTVVDDRVANDRR